MNDSYMIFLGGVAALGLYVNLRARMNLREVTKVSKKDADENKVVLQNLLRDAPEEVRPYIEKAVIASREIARLTHLRNSGLVARAIDDCLPESSRLYTKANGYKVV